MGNAVRTRLAGTKQPEIQKNVRTYGGPGLCAYQMVREPENEYDPNAIRVALFGQFTIGYIPKALAVDLAEQMDGGKQLEAEFVRLNIAPGEETIGITVDVVEVAV